MKYFLVLIFLILTSCAKQVTIVRPDQAENKPYLLKMDPPEYPFLLHARDIKGWVLVEYTVTEDGRVADAHVFDEYPPGVFSDYALKAINTAKFRPALANGKPVKFLSKKTLIKFETEGFFEKATCNNVKSVLEKSNCEQIQ